MARTILCTVGTSLLTSWRRKTNGGKATHQELEKFLKEVPDCSAETNSLGKMELQQRGDHLVFITSGTEEGVLAVEALANHYMDSGMMYVETRVVDGLNSNYHDFQQRGLPKLIEILSKLFIDNQGQEIVINATGGYKAQTATATLFGTMMGCEVVYLHEDFKNLISFPPIPLSVRQASVLAFRDSFQRILDTESAKEARHLINALPLELRGFFVREGGRYVYSPTGRIFLASMESGSAPRDYTVRTSKSHTTLWGDGVASLGEINDPEIRKIIKRAFDVCPAVTSLYLDEMQPMQTDDTFFEYIETLPGSLRYRVRTGYGAEYVKLEVMPGREQETLDRLGRKIFP